MIVDPNQNPTSEREWTEEEKDEFFNSNDAITGLPNGSLAGAWTSNGAGTPLSDNEPLTLDKLKETYDEFQKAFPIPVEFREGADMSRATFEELGKSIKLLKPQGQAWLGMNVDRFIGVDIHIVNSIPFGCVEECRCKEREKEKHERSI